MIAASEGEIGWERAPDLQVRTSLGIECRVTDKIEMESPTVCRGCWCVGGGVRRWEVDEDAYDIGGRV